MKKAFEILRAILPLVAVNFVGSGWLSYQPVATSSIPVDMAVPFAPSPARSNGKIHLAYELHLTNLRPTPLELDRIEILGPGNNGRPLATYSGEGLSKSLKYPGSASELPDSPTLTGGMRAVLFAWLTLDHSAPVPTRFHHRLYFKSTDGGQSLLEGGPTEVRPSPSPGQELGPPLLGIWVVANGPSNQGDHRRALIAIDGKARIAQRFALDLVRLGANGKAISGGFASNDQYLGYGAEVLAVKDASVAAVKDGIPENTPLSGEMAVPITLDTIAGNHVILNLGDGQFAIYAHLQPDSLRVAVGDRVTRGQVLGLVGNSGNSDLPHLHFQLCDRGSPLACEGLPSVFESFEHYGTVESVEALVVGEGWRIPDTTQIRRGDMLVEKQVLRFSN